MKARINIPDEFKKECERFCKEEIRRNGAEELRKLENEWVENQRKDVSVLILYSIRQFFGCGKDKLIKYHNEFDKLYDMLARKYEYDDRDDVLFTAKCELEKIGIEVDKI